MKSVNLHFLYQKSGTTNHFNLRILTFLCFYCYSSYWPFHHLSRTGQWFYFLQFRCTRTIKVWTMRENIIFLTEATLCPNIFITKLLQITMHTRCGWRKKKIVSRTWHVKLCHVRDTIFVFLQPHWPHFQALDFSFL